MSFSKTTRQMYARKKTVTRRLGWSFLKPGDRICAIEKGQGLKKGEHVKRIATIEIVSIRLEPLNWIGVNDVVAEGFPELSIRGFIEMFCKMNKCNLATPVNRIEFKFID